jgi:hypothetical protein
MILAALTWPEAAVRMSLIAGVAVVLSVLIWAIFRTGQTAISTEAGTHEQSRKQRAATHADRESTA